MNPTSFQDFLLLSVPTAIALLVSQNLGNLINVSQSGIISPLIGIIPGIGKQLTQLQYTIVPATETEPAVILQYGMVLSQLISFVIVCLVAYILVILSYRYLRVNATSKLA